jgi:hypothetical protein
VSDIQTPWAVRQRMYMRGQLIGLALLTLCASLALLVLSLVRPDDSDRFIRWWLLAIGAAVLATAASIVIRTLPRHAGVGQGNRKRSAVSETAVPDRLAQIERMITSATWSTLEYRARLRPVLLEIAEQRLLLYHAIDAQKQPERARAVIGSDIWELLTRSVVEPGAEGKGLTANEITRIVATLEGISATATR